MFISFKSDGLVLCVDCGTVYPLGYLPSLSPLSRRPILTDLKCNTISIDKTYAIISSPQEPLVAWLVYTRRDGQTNEIQPPDRPVFFRTVKALPMPLELHNPWVCDPKYSCRGGLHAEIVSLQEAEYLAILAEQSVGYIVIAFTLIKFNHPFHLAAFSPSFHLTPNDAFHIPIHFSNLNIATARSHSKSINIVPICVQTEIDSFLLFHYIQSTRKTHLVQVVKPVSSSCVRVLPFAHAIWLSASPTQGFIVSSYHVADSPARNLFTKTVDLHKKLLERCEIIDQVHGIEPITDHQTSSYPDQNGNNQILFFTPCFHGTRSLVVDTLNFGQDKREVAERLMRLPNIDQTANEHILLPPSDELMPKWTYCDIPDLSKSPADLSEFYQLNNWQLDPKLTASFVIKCPDDFLVCKLILNQESLIFATEFSRSETTLESPQITDQDVEVLLDDCDITLGATEPRCQGSNYWPWCYEMKKSLYRGLRLRPQVVFNTPRCADELWLLSITDKPLVATLYTAVSGSMDLVMRRRSHNSRKPIFADYFAKVNTLCVVVDDGSVLQSEVRLDQEDSATNFTFDNILYPQKIEECELQRDEVLWSRIDFRSPKDFQALCEVKNGLIINWFLADSVLAAHNCAEFDLCITSTKLSNSEPESNGTANIVFDKNPRGASRISVSLQNQTTVKIGIHHISKIGSYNLESHYIVSRFKDLDAVILNSALSVEEGIRVLCLTAENTLVVMEIDSRDFYIHDLMKYNLESRFRYLPVLHSVGRSVILKWHKSPNATFRISWQNKNREIQFKSVYIDAVKEVVVIHENGHGCVLYLGLIQGPHLASRVENFADLTYEVSGFDRKFPKLNNNIKNNDRAHNDELNLTVMAIDKQGDRLSVDRHLMDRHSVDRHSVDRLSEDRHSVDRHSMDRHSMDRHSVDRLSVDRHSMDRHSMDRHSVDRLSEDRHSEKGLLCFEYHGSLLWSVSISIGYCEGDYISSCKLPGRSIVALLSEDNNSIGSIKIALSSHPLEHNLPEIDNFNWNEFCFNASPNDIDFDYWARSKTEPSSYLHLTDSRSAYDKDYPYFLGSEPLLPICVEMVSSTRALILCRRLRFIYPTYIWLPCSKIMRKSSPATSSSPIAWLSNPLKDLWHKILKPDSEHLDMTCPLWKKLDRIPTSEMFFFHVIDTVVLDSPLKSLAFVRISDNAAALAVSTQVRVNIYQVDDKGVKLMVIIPYITGPLNVQVQVYTGWPDQILLISSDAKQPRKFIPVCTTIGDECWKITSSWNSLKKQRIVIHDFDRDGNDILVILGPDGYVKVVPLSILISNGIYGSHRLIASGPVMQIKILDPRRNAVGWFMIANDIPIWISLAVLELGWKKHIDTFARAHSQPKFKIDPDLWKIQTFGRWLMIAAVLDLSILDSGPKTRDYSSSPRVGVRLRDLSSQVLDYTIIRRKDTGPAQEESYEVNTDDQFARILLTGSPRLLIHENELDLGKFVTLALENWMQAHNPVLKRRFPLKFVAHLWNLYCDKTLKEHVRNSAQSIVSQGFGNSCESSRYHRIPRRPPRSQITPTFCRSHLVSSFEGVCYGTWRQARKSSYSEISGHTFSPWIDCETLDILDVELLNCLLLADLENFSDTLAKLDCQSPMDIQLSINEILEECIYEIMRSVGL